MAQSFYNMVLGGDKKTLECKQTCIQADLHLSCGIVDWETYIAQIGLPYEQSRIEGVDFYFEWLSYILQVKIKIWSSTTLTCIQEHCKCEQPSKVFNIMLHKVNDIHTHYRAQGIEPIVQSAQSTHHISTIALKRITQWVNVHSIKKII